MLWSFPAVTIGPPERNQIPALLDLGMRLTHPIMLRVAGLASRAGSRQAHQLDQLVPEGTRLVAVTEHLGHASDVRAHLRLDDGRDILHTVTGRGAPTPSALYGGGFDKAWRYPATVTKICDADTIWARLDTGTPTAVTAPIRVAHVNSPQRGGVAGDFATAWAKQTLPERAEITIWSRQLDKYGRILGVVSLSDGRDYGTRLLDAGHAVRYEGGPR